MEGAGTVEAVGPDVREIAPGDRVAWASGSGSYAEYTVLPVSSLVKLPDQIDLRTAAAVMLQGMTAHYLALSTYPIKERETALVHAAAGGVGLLLTQIIKLLGGRVIGTVSTQAKAELALAAGADAVIFYTRQDFEPEVKRLTGGRGADVVYDSVGASTFYEEPQLAPPQGDDGLLRTVERPRPRHRTAPAEPERVAVPDPPQAGRLLRDAAGIAVARRRRARLGGLGQGKGPNREDLPPFGSRPGPPRPRRPENQREGAAHPRPGRVGRHALAQSMSCRRRRARIAESLAHRKLDALIVAAAPNVRYLSGFTGSNGMLLVWPGGAVLFTDPRYEIQAAQETDCRVKVARGALYPALMKFAGAKKLKKLGFEAGRVSYEAYEQLRIGLALNASLVPVTGLVEIARMVKSEAEIALIERSVQTNSAAYEKAMRRARPGVSEADLAAEFEYQMRRLGAQKPAFDTLVATGAAHSPAPRPAHRQSVGE